MMRWRDRERVMMMVEVKTYCSFCFFCLFVCLLVFKYTAKKHAERVLRVSFYCFPGVVLLLVGWGVPVKLLYTE